MVDYYHATVLDYKLLWTGPRDLAMHFGYYECGTETHEESLLKMNEILARYAKIGPRDRVLDAGCGYGGSALWLVEKIGCSVVGVNVVPYQVAQAAAAAKKRGVAGRVRFERADYTALPFPDKSFDVIWGLESIVHAENKRNFIREAFRLLDNGGRILLSEYMLRESPPLSPEEKEKLWPWLEGWAMPGLLTPSEYQALLEEEGFSGTQVYDITRFVEPSLRRLGKMSRFSLPVAKWFRRLALFSKEHLDNVRASDLQFKALKEGLWRYTVVTASKPMF